MSDAIALSLVSKIDDAMLTGEPIHVTKIEAARLVALFESWMAAGEDLGAFHPLYDACRKSA